jgi:hypothetical protein
MSVVEQWRPIAGLEGSYEVSDAGRVRRVERTLSRGGKAAKFSGVMLRTKVQRNGYEYVNLSCAGRKRTYAVHRLVATAFIPNPDGKPLVNHWDNNPLNNTAANLSWATTLENRRHACAQLRTARKLSGAQIMEIRAVWDGLEPSKKPAFAATFGIGAEHARKIARGIAHRSYRPDDGKVLAEEASKEISR